MKFATAALGVISFAILAVLVAMHTGAFNVATAWQDPALLR